MSKPATTPDAPTSNPAWAYYFIWRSGYIVGRTAHLVDEIDGSVMKTECGRELERKSGTPRLEEGVPPNSLQCGNCPWESVEGADSLFPPL